MKAFWAPISSEDRITATAHFQEEKTKEKRDEGINRYWSGLSEEQLAQRMIFVNDPAVKKRKKEKMQAIDASGGGNCKPVRIHGVCYPSLHHAVPKFQKRKAAGTYSGPTGDKKIRELLNAEKNSESIDPNYRYILQTEFLAYQAQVSQEESKVVIE